MPQLGILSDLFVLFGLGVLAVVLCLRLRLSPLVGFLLTGMLCGPFGFKLIDGIHEVEALSEIGIILLLFTVGLEFSLERLGRLKTLMITGGGLQVVATMGVTLLLLRAASVPATVATFIGMLVSASSTAIVVRILVDRGEVETPHGTITLGILIFQDLCVVPMVLLIPFLGGEGGPLVYIFWVAIQAFALIACAVVAMRYAVPWLLYQVVRTRNREVFLLTIILLCLGTAWASAQVGLSLALGAFIAGLILSQSEYSHQALGEILPFREVFNSLFFISIGMLFDVRTILHHPGLVLLCVTGIVGVKAAVASGVTFAHGYSPRISVLVGLSLAQIGEFSFVLSKVGMDAGLLDAASNQLFLASAIATMAITPFLYRLAPAIAAVAERLVPARWVSRAAVEGADGSALADLEGHAIVVGYGVNGRNLVRVLARVGIPYVVIEMNPETARVERRKGIPVIFGDSSRPEVLKHAGIERARVAVIAISDAAATRRTVDVVRALNPAVHTIVRSRYVQEMEPLFALGAHEVIPEEFETSIEIFSRVLRRYLVPRDVIERSVEDVRKDGYEMFRSLRDVHRPVHDLKRFLTDLSLDVFRVKRGSALAGKRLYESGLRAQTGATVVAIQRPDGSLAANPASDTALAEGDTVIILGTPAQIAQAAALFEAAGGTSPSERLPPHEGGEGD